MTEVMDSVNLDSSKPRNSIVSVLSQENEAFDATGKRGSCSRMKVVEVGWRGRRKFL